MPAHGPAAARLALARSRSRRRCRPAPLPPLALDAYPPAARDGHRARAPRRRRAPERRASRRRARRACCTPGSNGTPRTRPTRAPRRSRRGRSSGATSTRVVLQRLARPADAAARLEEALDDLARLPAGASEAGRGAPRAGESRREPAAVRRADRDPARAPAAAVRARTHRRGPGAARRGRRAPPARRRALSRVRRRALRAGALLSRARTPDEAQAALAQHAEFGARWPAVDDPGAGDASTRCATIRARCCSAGVKLADAGDSTAAIAAHEAALARDPSLAQAHANLISLYGRTRNWAKAEEHYRAVVALGVNVADAHYDYGVLLGLQEQVGARGGRLPPGARAQSAARAGAQQSRPDARAPAPVRGRGRANTAQALESQPTLRARALQLGRMLIALARPDEAIAELQKLTEPRDAEAPRYLFALAAAHVRAGQQRRRHQVGDRGASSWPAVRADTSSRRRSSAIWRRIR